MIPREEPEGRDVAEAVIALGDSASEACRYSGEPHDRGTGGKVGCYLWASHSQPPKRPAPL